MKRFTTKQIALCGIIAGLYAAITILTASFAYGNIQFRIAESLCLLVCIDPCVTVGVTLGCLIANLFSTVSVLDIFVGTSATLLACLLTCRIKNVWLAPLPTIVTNGVLVGAMLAWVSIGENGFWRAFLLYGAEVAAGELAVLYVIGVPLLVAAKRSEFFRKLIK